jgi:hypothetical protein
LICHIRILGGGNEYKRNILNALQSVKPGIRQTSGLTKDELNIEVKSVLLHRNSGELKNPFFEVSNWLSESCQTPLCPWMKLLVYLLQSLRIDMRIYLGCRDIGMAEHGLHRTEVGSTFQQMCGK